MCSRPLTLPSHAAPRTMHRSVLVPPHNTSNSQAALTALQKAHCSGKLRQHGPGLKTAAKQSMEQLAKHPLKFCRSSHLEPPTLQRPVCAGLASKNPKADPCAHQLRYSSARVATCRTKEHQICSPSLEFLTKNPAATRTSETLQGRTPRGQLQCPETPSHEGARGEEKLAPRTASGAFSRGMNAHAPGGHCLCEALRACPRPCTVPITAPEFHAPPPSSKPIGKAAASRGCPDSSQ